MELDVQIGVPAVLRFENMALQPLITIKAIFIGIKSDSVSWHSKCLQQTLGKNYQIPSFKAVEDAILMIAITQVNTGECR